MECKNKPIILGVAAGKGGVGKSTVTAQLARAFQKNGAAVGVLDADIYGPSQIRLLNPLGRPCFDADDRVLPADAAGVKLMSAAFLPQLGELAVVRAPIANALIEQFFKEVDWGGVDLLLVDFPPGTGDIPITLMQCVPFHGVVMVTQPQHLSTSEVERAIRHVIGAGVPIAGLIENMCGMQMPDGSWRELFGPSSVAEIMKKYPIPSYVSLPFVPSLVSWSDRGLHGFEEGISHPFGNVLIEFAQSLIQRFEGQAATEEDAIHWALEGGMLRIRSKSGWESQITGAQLAAHCPCVRCRHGGQASSEATIFHVEPLGQYAVRVLIKGGCSQGIYPLSLLESIGSSQEVSSHSEPKA